MIKPQLWSKSVSGFSVCQLYWALKTGFVFEGYDELLGYLDENI